MILIHFLYKDKEEMGILIGDSVISLGVPSFDMLIEKYTLEGLKELSKSKCNTIKRSDIKPLAFINHPKNDILCIGMNYMSHKDECLKEGVDTEHRVAPAYFSKRASNVITNGDTINIHSDITSECDYEGELGVITYKKIYKASHEEAFDSIFGYVIINDVSARDLQRKHTQYYFAKSLDTYSVMSEVLITKDEFESLPEVIIKTYINNEIRQNDNTRNMIYSITDMLVEISSGITLDKGTILATGTPKGVGMSFNPKRFLTSGDVVRIEIEKIGILENKCI